jgi:hypothetical protein
MSFIQNQETLSQTNFPITVDELKSKSLFKVKTADIVKFNLGLAYFIVLIFLTAKLFLG